MNEIKITPQALIALADDLNTKAMAMKNNVENTHSLAQELKTVWQDKTQEEYEKDFANLSSSFEEYLNALPGFIRQAKDHAEAMIRIGG